MTAEIERERESNTERQRGQQVYYPAVTDQTPAIAGFTQSGPVTCVSIALYTIQIDSKQENSRIHTSANMKQIHILL